MINCSGTKFKLVKQDEGLWIFDQWQTFLHEAGLLKFDDFCQLQGKVMDRNRRSLVYRLELGPLKEIFYLKIHTNYYKQGLKTLQKKIPYTKIELNNIMRYAQIGFNALEPVAWGWQPERPEGAISFLLLKELKGYKSLQNLLKDPEYASPAQRRPLFAAVAEMIATMHANGIAHIDLYSWHIFAKKEAGLWRAHPIDLERTRRQGFWPWSRLISRVDHAYDLAALHLTIPWPQVNCSERLRLYKKYSTLLGTPNNRFFLKLVLFIAKLRGKKKRFKQFGVAETLNAK